MRLEPSLGNKLKPMFAVLLDGVLTLAHGKEFAAQFERLSGPARSFKSDDSTVAAPFA